VGEAARQNAAREGESLGSNVAGLSTLDVYSRSRADHHERRSMRRGGCFGGDGLG
jgi:hypothetical protein